MNWRRGLFRLWIVGTALFVIAVAFVSYSGIKEEFDAVTSRPETAMPSYLAEFRQQHPEYTGLSDAQLADAVYKRFYSDMPREELKRSLPRRSQRRRRRSSSFKVNCTSFRPTGLTRRSQLR
jgi:hypothetical protein